MLPIGLLDRVTLWPKAEREFLQMLAGALFLQIAVLVWVRFFLRQYAFGWKEGFGLNSSEAASATAYGILAGALFFPVAQGLQWLSACLMELAHKTPEAQAAVQALQDPNVSVGEKIVFGVVAVVLAPLVEESLFRGILYPAIKQLGYPRLALWGTSVLFAALHFNEPTFVPLVAFGLVLVRLYEAFGNLLAPIVAHSFFNAANFVILIFQDQLEHLFHLT
jgi:membrane protease YdiL (CAAX protease family)